MTNEQLIKIFTKSFYISLNNSESYIRELVEDSIDESTNTINLSKMVENRAKIKNSNTLLYNFLNNPDVINNTERFIELIKNTEDYKYGYPQIYLEEFVDNNFIKSFNNKINSFNLERNRKYTNPVIHKRERFNFVKDFLTSNNAWGKIDFSNISSRENLDVTTFDSPYRLYAKASYSKIAIGCEQIKKLGNKKIEDKINKDWVLKTSIDKQEQVNPYYALDYGTEALVYELFCNENENDKEKYWKEYIKAEEEYPKAIQNDVELPTHLRCALANFELALETINYVLQKDSDFSFEPHLFSEIKNNLISEWCHEPHVKTKKDLIHYEEWGTVYPIDKNKVKDLKNAFINLSNDIKKHLCIENDKNYSVKEIVKLLGKVYINDNKHFFDDFNRIHDIIIEFNGQLETSGGQNSLDKEIGENGNTIGEFISDEDITVENNYKNDTNIILSKLISSYEKTITKINSFFMFDYGYRTILIQYITKFGLDYFVNRESSRLQLIEDASESSNRKNTDNKIFYCWFRVLNNILSQIYHIDPMLLLNCFDPNSNNKISNCESFNDIYKEIKEIDLNVIEKKFLKGECLNTTIYEGIVNNWFESIKKDIQKYFNKNKDALKLAFGNIQEDIKTSTKYVDSIKTINPFELNKIIPIENPFIALIKDNNEFLDFESLIIRIEDAVKTGMLEELTFYNVAFELLKTGNKAKPAGDIWSNAWTQYKDSGGKLYSEEEFRRVMDIIADLGKTITRRTIKGENIYLELEALINDSTQSKFMQDLRMLLSGAELIYASDNKLEKFYKTVLGLMKNLGYAFVIKYDNQAKEDDYDYKSYDYETSLKEIINE